MNSSVVAANANAAREGSGLRASSTRIQCVDRLIGGPGDPRAVHEALHALTDTDLKSLGFNAYLINLLSLFGDEWPTERIAAAARAATISKLWGGWRYHHHYLPSLGPEPAPAQLDGGLVEQARALLSQGRGLLVTTFHIGHMRYVASDLAHAGIRLCMPLANDSFNNYASSQASNPNAAVWSNMTYVNVEAKGGALAIARILARGGVVFSTIDGNTGMDGPRGGDRRIVVRVLGRLAKVKDGLFRMAARFGTPVLPLVTATVDDHMHCVTAPVIDPGRPLNGSEADAFVEQGMQDAYDVLGQALRAYPEDWCGGDLFHQWRVPEPLAIRDPGEVDTLLSEAFSNDKTIVMNARRMVSLSDSDAAVWTDAPTMRCYRFPEDLRTLADRLSSPRGVDAEWLSAAPDAARVRCWTMLRQLAERSAVHVSDQAVPEG